MQLRNLQSKWRLKTSKLLSSEDLYEKLTNKGIDRLINVNKLSLRTFFQFCSQIVRFQIPVDNQCHHRIEQIFEIWTELYY